MDGHGAEFLNSVTRLCGQPLTCRQPLKRRLWNTFAGFRGKQAQIEKRMLQRRIDAITPAQSRGAAEDGFHEEDGMSKGGEWFRYDC